MPRSTLDDEPQAEYIRELYDHIQGSYWSKQRTLDKEFSDLYFGEHAIIAPDTANKRRQRQVSVDRFTTCEAQRIVNLKSTFYQTPPRIGMQFMGQGSVSEGKAERSAMAINEAIDQLNPATDSPWKDGNFDGILLGRFVDLTLPGHVAWQDFPYKEPAETEREAKSKREAWRARAPIPIMWLSLDAECTFPPSLGASDDEALNYRKMTWLDLLDLFSDKEMAGIVPNDRKALFDEVTLCTYSNRRWLGYYVLADKPSGGVAGTSWRAAYHDHAIRTIEHGMGRCAIRIVPCVTSGRKEPGYYWQSALYPVRHLLPALERLATRVATQAKFRSLPMLAEYKFRGSQGDGDGASAAIQEFIEGDLRTYYVDETTGKSEDIRPIFQPPAGADDRELLIWGLALSARLTGTPESLEGQLAPNAPAWSQNFSAEMGKHMNKPVTSAVISRAIDLAESISRATRAFGEPIALTKRDDEGHPAGRLMLRPEDLEDFEPMIVGSYDAKLPMNWRADMDEGMKLLTQSATTGFPAPQWIAEKMFGVEDFWKQHADWLEYQAMMAIKEEQIAFLKKKLEATIPREDGMTPGEAEGKMGGLPQNMQQVIRQFAGGGGGNGATPSAAVSPQTQGALRAGAPQFNAAPGGVAPQEQVAPL